MGGEPRVGARVGAVPTSPSCTQFQLSSGSPTPPATLEVCKLRQHPRGPGCAPCSKGYTAPNFIPGTQWRWRWRDPQEPPGAKTRHWLL